VEGGAEHTRFLHGPFYRIAAQGLSLVPVEQAPFGGLMRGFRRDSRPSEGWSVDWDVEDHLKYLPPSSDVHLRHTDLTRGAEVELAETWVSVGLYGGTAEAWIPSALVGRRAAEPPLSSTFVGVLEPYEGKSNIAGIRRLELGDSEAKPDGHVGIEVRLGDGRRDIFISRNVEAPTASKSDPRASESDRPARSPVVEKESGARFEGDLCLVRFSAAGPPEHALFCRGRSLRMGELFIRAKDEEASFEIALEKEDARVAAGPADAVDIIELGGVRVWPR
jgi:hypothetical protein